MLRCENHLNLETIRIYVLWLMAEGKRNTHVKYLNL